MPEPEPTPEPEPEPLPGLDPILPGYIILLGDSDSAPNSDFRHTSVTDYLDDSLNLARALAWDRILTSNQAENCTSAAESRCPNDGVTQTIRALKEIGDTRFAIVRYGLNDLHYQVPISRFREAYELILREIIDAGAIPVTVAIQREKSESYFYGWLQINTVIRDLAEETESVYVDPEISYEENRDLFARGDDVHLNDRGTEVVARVVEQGIADWLSARN